MQGQAIQRFLQDYPCEAVQVGGSRKSFLVDYGEYFVEYHCFGRDPRQASCRDGLVLS